MEYRLDQLFDLQMGKTPSRNNPEYWDSDDHKWISIADLSKCGKFITDTKECLSDRAVVETGISLIPANTVVMSFKLSIGKVAITSEPMYSNEAIMSFRDKGVTELDPHYLYYLFAGKDWDAGTNKAVMGKTLNKATLSKIVVDIRPIEEQREVVRVLDKAQEIIEARQAQLQKLDELVKARFVEMFGGGCYGEFELGSRMKTVSGGTPSKKYPEYFENGTIPWLTSGEINKGRIRAPEHFITKEGLDHSSAKLVPKNTVVVAMYGATAGQVGIVDYETTTNQAVCCIAPADICDPVYLRFALENKKAWMIEQCVGGAQPNISQGVVRKVTIPDASIESQRSFASFVAQVDKSGFGIAGGACCPQWPYNRHSRSLRMEGLLP